MDFRAKGKKANSVSYPPLLLRYGFAVASIVVALGFHLLSDTLFLQNSFLVLILGAIVLSASVMVSAWYGGLDVCCQVHAHSSLIRPWARPRRRLT
jgi:hypothetical protein